MDLPSLPAARLAWSDDLRIIRADGDCVDVLGAPADALVGRTLAEGLGISRAESLALAAPGEKPVRFVRARAPGASETALRWLRLGLGEWDGARAASVVDFDALLEGAPPVQLGALAPPLSHELRNPLSSVKMAVQMLARSPDLSERNARRLTIANREIRTLERMLSALAEYGRERTPTLEARPLRALVEKAASLAALELSERSVQLAIDEEEGLPDVLVEPARLEPLVAQLLIDVAAALPEGGTVSVRLFRAEEGVRMALDDATPSLSESPLFEPFGAPHRSGLALPALRRALGAQHGSITADPVGEAGLRFTLTLTPA